MQTRPRQDGETENAAAVVWLEFAQHSNYLALFLLLPVIAPQGKAILTPTCLFYSSRSLIM